MTGDPPFISYFQKGSDNDTLDAKFNRFLTVGYFLIYFFEVTVTLSNTLLCIYYTRYCGYQTVIEHYHLLCCNSLC